MSPTPMETLIHNVDLDRSMSSNVDDDELWDATTPWDTQIEVPAQLIEDVDDNVKARQCLICHNITMESNADQTFQRAPR